MSDTESPKKTYHSYHELRVWEKAIELSREVLTQVQDLQKEVKQYFGQDLIDLSLTIPSLIANGFASRSKKEYVDSLKQGLRNVSKIETSVLTIGEETPLNQSISPLLVELRKMLASLTSALTKPAKEQAEPEVTE